MKIDKLITKFINDPKKCVTQISQVEPGDILDKIIDFKEFMNEE